MKFYKVTFKGRSLKDVHDDIGQRGGMVVRIDQQADEITGYYEADDQAPGARAAGDAKEVSLQEVTRVGAKG